MDEIREKLKKAIYKLYGVEVEPEITVTPENVGADFSSNVALKLAKIIHKNPMEIAEDLRENMDFAVAPRSEVALRENMDLVVASQLCSVTVSQPGFVNFSLNNEFLKNKLDDLARNFTQKVVLTEYEGKTVVCEFSDPNPFKVLHVGHLYTSVVGDAISRLYEQAGARVIRANFGGDVGLHVAKTMYMLRRKDVGELTIEDIARCYVEGTAVYEDDPEARAAITALNKEIYKINAENIHEGETAELYWRGRELSYEYFRDFYQKIGVEFDKYYPESTVAALGLSTVLRELENGVYEKSDGAVVFDGEKYGLHTRVFVNREGVPTYEAKDVGLIFQKYEDWQFDKSVVITGAEQTEYMKVVLKSVEQYAPELVEKTKHLTHGLVKLPGNEKMSSRKGNFLRAVDVLGMVSEALSQEYGSSDETVMLAAVKYAFLKYKMGGDIIFDPKESVKMTGNSGPYLLYSAVRARKILAKVGGDIRDDGYDGAPGDEVASDGVGTFNNDASDDGAPDDEPSGNSKPLTYNTYERSLIKKLICYKDVLAEAVQEMAPHKLASYLYEVAQEFSRFYENCPVAGDEKEKERGEIVQVYLNTLTHGLGILGIKIPEEM